MGMDPTLKYAMQTRVLRTLPVRPLHVVGHSLEETKVSAGLARLSAAMIALPSAMLNPNVVKMWIILERHVH